MEELLQRHAAELPRRVVLRRPVELTAKSGHYAVQQLPVILFGHVLPNLGQ